jgi:hypothetical protein
MRILANVLLLSASIILSVLGAELLSRFLVDPVDHLFPRLVSDEFLTHRVDGYSGGHDAWGFRNTRVPESADIVCIGDSMTYGIAAQARDSWPAVLGKIRATTVYNMGLGGYGPIQYLHLMRTQAVKLHPKIVIVGLFLGNDVMDVYNEVRFNKNWSKYGTLGGSDVKGAAFATQPPPGKYFGSLRNWLAEHSVLYALLTRTGIFDSLRNLLRKREMLLDDQNVITYRDESHDVVFDLSTEGRYLNMDDPRIKSALEITKQVMLDMRAVAEKERFRLIVAMIPTKERVYRKLLQRVGFLQKQPRLSDVINHEDRAHDVMVRFLQQANIEVVDLLPDLETAVEKGDPYPLTDAHPNAEGYRVIATTIDRMISTSPR